MIKYIQKFDTYHHGFNHIIHLGLCISVSDLFHHLIVESVLSIFSRSCIFIADKFSLF